MRGLLFSIAAGILFAAGSLILPDMAEAAEGYATADVNVRAGPSLRYPAVDLLRQGEPVEVLGCLANLNWCDVAFEGNRGWVSGRYVEVVYGQHRSSLRPTYYRSLRIPVILFDLNSYWSRYYRDRPFYGDIYRWRHDGDQFGGGYHRPPADPVPLDPDDSWRGREPVQAETDGVETESDHGERDKPCFGCVQIFEERSQTLKPCLPGAIVCEGH